MFLPDAELCRFSWWTTKAMKIHDDNIIDIEVCRTHGVCLCVGDNREDSVRHVKYRLQLSTEEACICFHEKARVLHKVYIHLKLGYLIKSTRACFRQRLLSGKE